MNADNDFHELEFSRNKVEKSIEKIENLKQNIIGAIQNYEPAIERIDKLKRDNVILLSGMKRIRNNLRNIKKEIDKSKDEIQSLIKEAKDLDKNDKNYKETEISILDRHNDILISVNNRIEEVNEFKRKTSVAEILIKSNRVQISIFNKEKFKLNEMIKELNINSNDVKNNICDMNEKLDDINNEARIFPRKIEGENKKIMEKVALSNQRIDKINEDSRKLNIIIDVLEKKEFGIKNNQPSESVSTSLSCSDSLISMISTNRKENTSSQFNAQSKLGASTTSSPIFISLDAR